MKVAFASHRCFVVFIFAATFARRLRAVATVGRRQMPATRIGLRPTRIYTNVDYQLTFIRRHARGSVAPRRTFTSLYLLHVCPYSCSPEGAYSCPAAGGHSCLGATAKARSADSGAGHPAKAAVYDLVSYKWVSGWVCRRTSRGDGTRRRKSRLRDSPRAKISWSREAQNLSA